MFCGLLLAFLWGCTPTESPVAEIPKTTSLSKQSAAPKPIAHAPADSLVSFSWQDEVCTNTGYYQRGAYTEAQLRDTHELVDFYSVLPSTTVFDLKDYNDANFKQAGRAVQHTYDSISSRLRSLSIVPTPFWQKMKRLRILELAESFRLSQAALQGYFQPSRLLQDPTYPHCKEYADALSSTDTAVVLNAWGKLLLAQRQKNGAPDRLEQEFKYQATSPDRMKYAKIALMTFGWYNCANDQRRYTNLNDQYQPQQQFEKLFKRVTTADCVDVD